MIFQYLFFIINLYVFNFFIKFFIIDKKAIWFFIHSYGNAIITYYSLLYIIPFITKPHLIIDKNEEIYDTTILILIMHLFHILHFKVNKSDLFHHISFVFFGTFFKLIINMGSIIAFYHFFICGLPGCIDYFVLGLNRLQIINRNYRLEISNEINIWIRSPGLIASHTLLVLYFFKEYNGILPYIFSLGSYFFTSFNGIYYMRQVFSANERKKMSAVSPLKE